MANQKNKIVLITFLATFAWLLYAFIYCYLKNNVVTTKYAGYLSLIGETGLDILATLLVYQKYKSFLTREKNFFLILFFSFFVAVIADSIYNVVLNLFQFQYINPIIASLFEIPFAMFLFFQLLAWSWILFNNNEEYQKKNKKSYIPYGLVSLIIFIIFMFGIHWRINYFSIVGLFQVIDTFFEVMGFALATISLARSQTILIKYSAIGYLLIVSSDFIIRSNVVSGIVPYLSSFEATWILGLLYFCLGFYLSRNNDKLPILNLSPINSLKSQIAGWLLVLWLASVLIFAISYFLFSINSINYISHLTKNFLAMLVPFSVLAVISSNYISTMIAAPLSKLENIIDDLINSVSLPNQAEENFIYEFKKLEKFVYNALQLFQEKHFFEMEFAKLATQVVHDIKSPLVVIENLFKELNTTLEEKNIFLSANNRLIEITEILMLKHRFLGNKKNEKHISNNSKEIIFLLISEIISEKRAQYTNIKIKLVSETSTEKAFCLINASDFKRVISNLINNSVEALVGIDGEITVFLKQRFNKLEIVINDTGCGIPKNLISKIIKGVSFGKKLGNGLGLRHAINCIHEWGGSYHINSEINVGTQFTIILNIAPPADWLLETIYVTENQKLVLVDDDSTMYDLWKRKFLMLSFKNIILYFNTPESFLDYFSLNVDAKESLQFLIDYHFLNSKYNGLDIINKIAPSNAILVTNQYPSRDTQKILSHTNSKLIFKKDISFLVMQILYRNPDLVLLDDKIIITKMWLREAKINNKKIVVFNKKEVMMKYINIFDLQTPMYIDSDLDGADGMEVAKELHHRKFHNIYITTGYEKNRFSKFRFLKDVIGKEPPFLKKNVQGCII